MSVVLSMLVGRAWSMLVGRTDVAKFVELRQGGAAAGYELWRELDKELSVRSRVEGQALT